MRHNMRERFVNSARKGFAAPKKLDKNELTQGVDPSLDKRQWALWKRIKHRFEDDGFTHSLLDRMITTTILNICVALVWLGFIYIAVKIIMR